MKPTTSITSLLALALCAATANAATTFQGGDPNNGGNWSAGLPSSSNPGTIAVDGSGGSFQQQMNGTTIDHTAGTLSLTTNWNLYGSYTYNMSGGGITSTATQGSRGWFVNQGTFNMSGGSISTASGVGPTNGGVFNMLAGDGTISIAGLQGNGGTMDFKTGWTGSFTIGNFSGSSWENLFTGGGAIQATFNGEVIDATAFAANFEVSADGKTLTMVTTEPPVTPLLTGFTYAVATGACEVSIEGAANTAYKLVEAADLDFSSPDQDPVPLDAATVGTLAGDVVTTDGDGNATVEFELTGDATFIRAEEN